MRNRNLVRVVAIVVLVGVLLTFGAAAMAQEGGGGSPSGEIIPEPNSGEPPEEAGDRGGSLQVGLLVLIGVAVAGMGAYVAHRSRPTREARARRVEEERLARARKGGATSGQ